jgi:hypothetical protein
MQHGRLRQFCVRQVQGRDSNARREIAEAAKFSPSVWMVRRRVEVAVEPSAVSLVRVDRTSGTDV